MDLPEVESGSTATMLILTPGIDHRCRLRPLGPQARYYALVYRRLGCVAAIGGRIGWREERVDAVA